MQDVQKGKIIDILFSKSHYTFFSVSTNTIQMISNYIDRKNTAILSSHIENESIFLSTDINEFILCIQRYFN